MCIGNYNHGVKQEKNKYIDELLPLGMVKNIKK